MREIKALTSLRGVAAMAVVLTHFSATAQQHSRVTIPSLVPHGYIAVDLFFALSGFIMAHTYAAAFEAGGWRAFPTFIARRVARIVPLNVAVIAALLAAAAASVALVGHNIFFTSADLPFDVAANLLMLQGLNIGENLNGPSWSISTEFAAYLVFPLFVLGVFRSAALAAVLSAAAVAALCWLSTIHQVFYTDTAAEALLRTFALFGLGMVAGGAYRDPRVARVFGRDLAAFGLAGACALSMVLRHDLPAILLFPWLVLALACNDGLMATLMASRPVHFLGVISFSLYLIHNPFRPLELAMVRAMHPAPLDGAAAMLFAFLGSLSIIPFAWIAYRLVEQPGRRWVRWALSAGRSASVGASAGD